VRLRTIDGFDVPVSTSDDMCVMNAGAAPLLLPTALESNVRSRFSDGPRAEVCSKKVPRLGVLTCS
jgi:hypothetical protein